LEKKKRQLERDERRIRAEELGALQVDISTNHGRTVRPVPQVESDGFGFVVMTTAIETSHGVILDSSPGTDRIIDTQPP